MSHSSRQNTLAGLVSGLLVAAAAPLAGAECLQTGEKGLANIKAEEAYSSVVWYVTLKNKCSAYVDANMTVALIDDQGKELYTLNQLSSLGYREETRVENEAYVPSDVAENATDIDLKLEENKRD